MKYFIFNNTQTGKMSLIEMDDKSKDLMWINKMLSRIVPKGTVCHEIPEKPTDWTFQDAWEEIDGKISINIAKARNIHMDRIRHVRNIELSKLDQEEIAFTRKTRFDGSESTEESKDKQLEIDQKKQTLCDIPQTFNLEKYETPESLKTAWPEELPEATDEIFKTVYNF